MHMHMHWPSASHDARPRNNIAHDASGAHGGTGRGARVGRGARIGTRVGTRIGTHVGAHIGARIIGASGLQQDL
jgi:hypothetical protein